MKKIFVHTIFLLLASLAFAYESPFMVDYDKLPIKAGAGQEMRLAVTIRIPYKHFIYKDRTSLDFTVLEGVRVKAIDYPATVSHADPLTGESVLVFPEGEAVITAKLFIPKTLTEGAKKATALLEFQGCEDKLCLRPEVHTLEWDIRVGPSSGKVSEIGTVAYSGARPSINTLLQLSDFKDIVREGWLISFLIAFIAGLLTSLTPCVWPLVPVTLLIIGIHKKGNIFKNLLLSLSLTAGIAVTYGLFGAFAGAAGRQIGFLFQKKAFIIAVSAFFITMSLSMFGLFTINLPKKAERFFSRLGGSGYRGAFLMGISLGFMATPCAGPLVAGMFVWVAAEKEYLFGALTLGFYALGFGMCYVLTGTFYGTLSQKIKSVRVGVFVKKVMGVMLLVPAVYYLSAIFPSRTNNGFVAWRSEEPSALIEAVSEKKPLIIVFGAKWCLPCVEIERKVFADKAVADAVKNVVPLHVDATVETKEVNRLLDKYKVVGWPSILFVSSSGAVYDDLKIVGEVPSVQKLLDNINLSVEREN